MNPIYSLYFIFSCDKDAFKLFIKKSLKLFPFINFKTIVISTYANLNMDVKLSLNLMKLNFQSEDLLLSSFGFLVCLLKSRSLIKRDLFSSYQLCQSCDKDSPNFILTKEDLDSIKSNFFFLYDKVCKES